MRKKINDIYGVDPDLWSRKYVQYGDRKELKIERKEENRNKKCSFLH